MQFGGRTMVRCKTDRTAAMMGLMRHAILTRDESTDEGTRGVLEAGGLCLHVIEPPWRDNLRNRSCIPPGRYEVTPHLSPRFGRVLRVADVEARSHILIHAGNIGGDTKLGYHTHTLGCLLPGLRRGCIEVSGCRQRAVLASRPALRKLMGWAGERPFELEICHA